MSKYKLKDWSEDCPFDSADSELGGSSFETYDAVMADVYANIEEAFTNLDDDSLDEYFDEYFLDEEDL